MESRELPTAPGLSVRDVTVSFGGITALDGVSVDVSRGEVLGIIGPNGAGKTTLFNVICGFVKPDSGSLSWRGQALEPDPPATGWPGSGSRARSRASGCSRG